MARRGREAALKRAREKTRQEKQEAKRERRTGKKVEGNDPATENALMEEFARLNESRESGQISIETYNTERHRIFVELGLESEDE